MPERIQRKRTKGWRMPENTVYVGRPSRWGNEFEMTAGDSRQLAVEMYAAHLQSYFGFTQRMLEKAFHPWPVEATDFKDWLAPLRGKNLACWCPPDEPCHADLLLKLANADDARRERE